MTRTEVLNEAEVPDFIMKMEESGWDVKSVLPVRWTSDDSVGARGVRYTVKRVTTFVVVFERNLE